jgi:hypothetical protein|tara:strand:+ start:4847 stop:5656 length:810 start_codon:yes stop_codon:yes gene_type:complete
MNKQVFRFISPDNIELYNIKRGKLIFKDRIKSKDCAKIKTDKVILTASHYVSASMLAESVKFVPEKGQFLFSDQSILRIEDLIHIPAIYDEVHNTWKQFWASSHLLLDIKALIPSAKYFYPECLALTEHDTNKDNLSDAKFLNDAFSFQPIKSRDKNKLFLFTLIAGIFLAIAPWISHWFDYNSKERLVFENKVLLIQYFEQLAVSSELSGLKKLTFNKSLKSIEIITHDLLNEIQKSEVEKFCKELSCKIKFDNNQININFQKRLSSE